VVFDEYRLVKEWKLVYQEDLGLRFVRILFFIPCACAFWGRECICALQFSWKGGGSQYRASVARWNSVYVERGACVMLLKWRPLLFVVVLILSFLSKALFVRDTKHWMLLLGWWVVLKREKLRDRDPVGGVLCQQQAVRRSIGQSILWRDSMRNSKMNDCLYTARVMLNFNWLLAPFHFTFF